VKLDQVELIVVRLPLVRPFVTANGSTAERDVLLVHVRADDAEGWGECGAETTASYWWETVATAQRALPPIARGEPVDGHPMAHAAFEMAMLDAELHVEGRSLAAHLGVERDAVPATATAGFEDDVDAFVEAGYRSIKVKVAPGHLGGVVARDAGNARDDITLQVDANGAYADAPERVHELDGLGLLCIEQPLAAHDLAGHAAVARELQTTICLDESVTGLDALDRAIKQHAGGAATVKAARLGGIAAALLAHDRCVAAGWPAKVGGLLETGIGRAAALAVAGLPGFVWPADLSASDRYWREDLTEPFVLDGDGCLAIPSGPGLGVNVRSDVVDAAMVWREVIEL
jgi:O-succinylbenzoate synthase